MLAMRQIDAKQLARAIIMIHLANRVRRLPVFGRICCPIGEHDTPKTGTVSGG